MRRALPAIIATLGGLALLANFHTAASVKPRIVSAPATTTIPAAGSGPPSSGSGSPTTTGPAANGSRPVDGPVIGTQFGDVQVRVTVVDGRITDVRPLQLPFEHPRSQEISQQAAPLLRSEVLQAQSAQIDLVSGATFTSEAYQHSLQGALDQKR